MRTSGKSRDKAPKERGRPGRKGRGQTLAKDDEVGSGERGRTWCGAGVDETGSWKTKGRRRTMAWSAD